MTARAMSATRRMYSTMLAPRSVFVYLADNQVRTTNRFIRIAPLLGVDDPRSPGGRLLAPQQHRRRRPRTEVVRALGTTLSDERPRSWPWARRTPWWSRPGRDAAGS